MARKRASMREGPLAELFRATEAAQRQEDAGGEAQPPESPVSPASAPEPPERTVEHVPTWDEGAGPDPPPPPVAATPAPPDPRPDPTPAPRPPDPAPEPP